MELKDKDIEYKFGYVVINGEYYQEASKDGKVYLKHIDKKDVKERREMANKISDKLKNKLDSRKVIMESIMKIRTSDIRKLFRMLFKDKKNYVVKTREHRCVDVKIGNFILPLVD